MNWFIWQIYKLFCPAKAKADEAFFNRHQDYLDGLEDDPHLPCPRCGLVKAQVEGLKEERLNALLGR